MIAIFPFQTWKHNRKTAFMVAGVVLGLTLNWTFNLDNPFLCALLFPLLRDSARNQITWNTVFALLPNLKVSLKIKWELKWKNNNECPPYQILNFLKD